MSKKNLKKTTIIGYILIAISVITLIIQGLMPNEFIKFMSMLLAIMYVVGCELIKLPLYQYTKKNEKQVKKYMKLAIIPDIPLYILMIVVLNIGYSGGHFLDQTEYGLFMVISHLILYIIEDGIIIIPCLILHCIGFFKLVDIKTQK